MTTPALRALRRRFPEAWITAQLPPTLAPLLDGAGLVDDFAPLASRDRGLPGWRRDLGWLRARRFDLGVLVPESVSSALLMRAGGVRRTVGFARDPLRRALLDEVVPASPDWGRRRMVSRERMALALVASLGGAALPADETPRLELAVTPEEDARLDASLARAAGDAERELAGGPIVVAPGASFGDAKCWPVDRYAALVDRLTLEGWPVVLLGAPGESGRIAAVRGRLARSVVVLDGALDVGALKALMRRARALVANDAGRGTSRRRSACRA